MIKVDISKNSALNLFGCPEGLGIQMMSKRPCWLRLWLECPNDTLIFCWQKLCFQEAHISTIFCIPGSTKRQQTSLILVHFPSYSHVSLLSLSPSYQSLLQLDNSHIRPTSCRANYCFQHRGHLFCFEILYLKVP